jgi:hypothetical protein
VVEAKDEVLLRRKELDSTKDKMDVLLEKLYANKEANSSLSGAIAAAAGNHFGISYPEDKPPAPAAARTGGRQQQQQTGRPRNPAIQREPPPQQQQQQHRQQQQAHGVMQRHPAPHQPQQQQQQGYYMQPSVPLSPGALMPYQPMMPWQAWGGASFAGGILQTPASMGTWGHAQQQQQQHLGASLLSTHMQQHQTLPSITRHAPQQQQQQQQLHAAADGPASRTHGAPSVGAKTVKGKGGSYAQQLRAGGHGQHSGATAATAPATAASTVSRLPRYAAAAKSSTSPAAAAKSGQGSKKPQAPDRFKEAGRNVAMINAIASRW